MSNRKRRGRGEGSIAQRKDKLWVARVSQGYDRNGKRIRLVAYGKTKTAAQNELDELRKKSPASIDAGKMTVPAYVTHWLDNVHAQAVGKTSHAPEVGRANNWLIPHLGPVRLVKLSAVHVEQLYANLEKAGCSTSERKRCGKLLRQVLKHALEKGLVPTNVATLVPLPKHKPEEIHPLDADQARKFLDVCEGHRLYALFVLALDSGMRQGELFGLQWDDLDFDAGCVQVRHSLAEHNGELWIKDVKTKAGRRRIKLAEDTIAGLNDHRAAQLAAGHHRADGVVFLNRQGGWLRKASVVRNTFQPMLKRAGLPDIRFHDLRHTCATLLLMADENPKVVQERLGHSKIEMTLNTYSHVLPTMQDRAATKMQAILGGRRKKAT